MTTPLEKIAEEKKRKLPILAKFPGFFLLKGRVKIKWNFPLGGEGGAARPDFPLRK